MWTADWPAAGAVWEEPLVPVETRHDGLCVVFCSMMKLARKRKTVCLALGVSFLTLIFLVSQSLVRDEGAAIAANLAQIEYRLRLNPERSDSGSFPVAGQLTYLGQVISDNVTQENRKCTPVLNVAFVKTHKAGSSTVANILQRFGISRNLTFALPNTKIHSYGYNYISRAGQVLTPRRFIPLKDGSYHGYNILYNHAIYNRTAFRLVMPDDTRYITILREPFSQFVSAFEYYGAKSMLSKSDKSILKADNPISSYLQNPYKYEKVLNYFSYVKNKQAEDLGLGWNEYFIPSKLTKYLETLRADFTLVMIMEFFDESLLLLKRKLCWDLKDILYIPKNKNVNKPERNFTRVDHSRHERLSHLDYKLYAYFLKAFKEELHRQGRDFFEELTYFRAILKKVHHSCTSGTTFYTAATRWHGAFQLGHRDCRLMLISELAGFDLLLERAGASDWRSERAGKDGVKDDAVKQVKLKRKKGKLVPHGNLVAGWAGPTGGEEVKHAGLGGEGQSLENAEKQSGDPAVAKGKVVPEAVVGVGGLGVAQAVVQGEEVARVKVKSGSRGGLRRW